MPLTRFTVSWHTSIASVERTVELSLTLFCTNVHFCACETRGKKKNKKKEQFALGFKIFNETSEIHFSPCN